MEDGKKYVYMAGEEELWIQRYGDLYSVTSSDYNYGEVIRGNYSACMAYINRRIRVYNANKQD